MNFDMSATTGVKEGGKMLTAGIHNAKFNGLELGTITSQKDGSTYKVMSLKLDIDGYGEFTHNFFAPKSAERTESQFGLNPSPVEHFMIALRQIFDAVNPKIGEAIDNGTAKIGGDFDTIVKLAAKYTASAIGTEVEVKLIPQNTGFNDIPGFPARINKVGALGIATRFIGHNLTLSQSEQRKIEAAQNSRPTNMATQSDSTLDGLSDALGISDDKDSDLPF